jgi:predicted GNAT family acetyltransferase
MSESFTVEHEPARLRFVIRLSDGGEATLSYTPGTQAWDFYHVFVPTTHRGQGLAAVVTRGAFDHVRGLGLGVVPTCPYVREQFLKRYPQYQDMVATR